MKQFRYNKQKNEVDEIPTMDEPKGELTILGHVEPDDDFFIAQKNRYKKHLQSLLTSIPVSGEVDWVDGQVLEEGKDLKLRKQVRRIGDMLPKWYEPDTIHEYEALKDEYKRISAICLTPKK